MMVLEVSWRVSSWRLPLGSAWICAVTFNWPRPMRW